MKLPVSYLFVPGDRPDRFAKALAAGAQAIIIDLEDAVAPDAKSSAREHIRARAESRPSADVDVLVRINDVATPWFEADLTLIRECAIRGIVLPKAERATDIARLMAALPREGFVVPIVETARGVLNVDEVASAAGVQRIAFGTLDYAVDLDLSGDERGLIYPACRMALASKAAGIATPIGSPGSAMQNSVRSAIRAGLRLWRRLPIHLAARTPTVRSRRLPRNRLGQRVVAAVESDAVRCGRRQDGRPAVILKAAERFSRAQRHCSRLSAPARRRRRDRFQQYLWVVRAGDRGFAVEDEKRHATDANGARLAVLGLDVGEPRGRRQRSAPRLPASRRRSQCEPAPPDRSATAPR